jgi:hypothetical protein
MEFAIVESFYPITAAKDLRCHGQCQSNNNSDQSPFLWQYGAPQGGKLKSPQPPLDADAATWARPGKLIRRSSFSLAHWGHATDSSPNTKVSKTCSHDWQAYSYIGMGSNPPLGEMRCSPIGRRRQPKK